MFTNERRSDAVERRGLLSGEIRDELVGIRNEWWLDIKLYNIFCPQ